MRVVRLATAPRPAVEEDFFAREAAVPDEDFAEGLFFAGLFEEVFDRELEVLGFLRTVADLRDDEREREDFEDVFFFDFDAPRAAADFRPVFLARLELFDLLAALPAAFFFFVFFATRFPPLPGPRRSPDHTIRILSNRDGDRVLITVLPAGLRIEVKPLVRSRRQRRRLALMAAGLVGAALFAAARLAFIWEAGLRKGDYSQIPLPVLIALSAAVGLSTPLVLLGLAALAFAEELVEVGPAEVVIRTAAFEATTVRRIDRSALECWRETLLPLPPWWTWSVARLAARASGRFYPLAAMAGPREKRKIGAALARATGTPFVDDFGRELPRAARLLNSFSD
ncbi:MAG: hypothetical protein M3167_17755 [Acidobacteriota bacterium]|nr:hypothetical protein [Acidobacteriota bacterium]